MINYGYCACGPTYLFLTAVVNLHTHTSFVIMWTIAWRGGTFSPPFFFFPLRDIKASRL